MSRRDLFFLLWFTSLLCLELFGKGHPANDFAAGWMWLLTLAVAAVITTKTAAKAFVVWSQRRDWIWLLTAGSIGALIFYQSVLVTNCSFESTQQIGCAVRNLLSRTDLGVYETCFLSYPSIQYWLFALPSLWLKQSCFVLNLGHSAFSFICITVFFRGVQMWAIGQEAPRSVQLYLPLFLLGCFLHCHNLVFSILAFEQTALPPLLALLLASAVLFGDSRHAMLFIAVIATKTYTPALAVASAALFFLGILWLFRGLPQILVGGGFFLHALGRPDLKIGNLVTTGDKFVDEGPAILKALFLDVGNLWQFSPGFWFVFGFGIVAAWRAKDFKPALCMLAGLGVLLVAVFADGYFRTEVFSRLFRGSAGSVFLITAAVLGSKYYWPFAQRNAFFGAGLALFLTTGLAFSAKNIQVKQDNKILSYLFHFIDDAKSQVPIFTEIQRRKIHAASVVISPQVAVSTTKISNLSDGGQYFLPWASFNVGERTCSTLRPQELFIGRNNLSCGTLWGIATSTVETSGSLGRVSLHYINR
jgi:hypothetical protein